MPFWTAAKSPRLVVIFGSQRYLIEHWASVISALHTHEMSTEQ
jgi:hypothetical protein